jgi:3-oxoacyl-[acyl-carrier-protein] synthase-3
MPHSPVFSKVSVLASARDEGPDFLSTSSLEEVLSPLLKSLSLPEDVLGRMTGVMGRYLYPRDSPPSRGGIRAAFRLFEKSGFSAKDVDLVYSTSVGRDFLEPSVASLIHSEIKAPPTASNLDLGSACLGFMEGLYLAALQVEYGLIDRALVVAGENARPVLENTLSSLYKPGVTRELFFQNFATLTLGSGGAAMLVGNTKENPKAPRLIRLVRRTDPSSNDLCRGDSLGMTTDASKLMNKGVALALETFREGAEKYGWDPSYFDLIVSHQVSEANTRKFAETLSLPWDRIIKTYPTHGNMGPVAVPFTFDLAGETGLLREGSKVAMVGIGSGLSCAMLEVEIP